MNYIQQNDYFPDVKIFRKLKFSGCPKFLEAQIFRKLKFTGSPTFPEALNFQNPKFSDFSYLDSWKWVVLEFANVDYPLIINDQLVITSKILD